MEKKEQVIANIHLNQTSIIETFIFNIMHQLSALSQYFSADLLQTYLTIHHFSH